jgi:glucosyl-3-phosphoglycerate synthase
MTDKKRRVIAAGTTPEEIAHLVPFARALAQAQQREILALGLVTVPEGGSLSAGARPAQRLRRGLKALMGSPDVTGMVRVTHHPWGEAQATVRQQDLLLVNWASALPEDALRTMPCDIIVVNGMLPSKVRRILVPIRGGPYAVLALQVALAFAQIHQAEVTLLHAAPNERLTDKEYQKFLHRLCALPQVTQLVNVGGNAADAILHAAQSGDCQMIVLGAIAQPQPGDPPIGPTAMRIVQESAVPVLIVKRYRPFPPQPSPVDYTISVVVDKWFAENTFHASEFRDLKHLVRLKEQQGLTISLGLPALNEEKTIGQIIKTVRTQCVERFPLLDEIVVIDSNSTDRTVKIAQDLGMPVYPHPEILPQYGSYVGKGEALWKSLFVLKGDIVAWIDTDILNIHPRFVYGILGPLIREPRLMYIKGFYQRPLRVGKKMEARGGGRVTELTARPLLNLFYPELSGFVQPLAGEYAGRRKALENVPFFAGYGVETGLLIDLLARCGLGAMGQVDLEERVHRNQSLLVLSKMAFEIVQVVSQRAGHSRGVELINELNKSMKLIHYSRDEFQLAVADIRARERPPMISLAEYRQKRGIPA